MLQGIATGHRYIEIDKEKRKTEPFVGTMFMRVFSAAPVGEYHVVLSVVRHSCARIKFRARLYSIGSFTPQQAEYLG